MADESIDGPIVAALRADGHPVYYIAESSSGIADPVVLAKSLARRTVLVTADKDFGKLVFSHGLQQCGVLLVRLAGATRSEKVDCVLNAFRLCGESLIGEFAVLNKRAIRIRGQSSIQWIQRQ